uniref:Uncharacterized protein n=1 Tax=Anguilla anguilla TaxID=7936 RepID=A0A0E9RB95_ANGAN
MICFMRNGAQSSCLESPLVYYITFIVTNGIVFHQCFWHRE